MTQGRRKRGRNGYYGSKTSCSKAKGRRSKPAIGRPPNISYSFHNNAIAAISSQKPVEHTHNHAETHSISDGHKSKQPNDPYVLSRFLAAQEVSYPQLVRKCRR